MLIKVNNVTIFTNKLFDFYKQAKFINPIYLVITSYIDQTFQKRENKEK